MQTNLLTLTFRTFFSNISNLFRNSMKEVFCTKVPKYLLKIYIYIQLSVNACPKHAHMQQMQ